MDSAERRNDVAIIGMACRLPGIANPQQLWDALLSGDCTVRRLHDAELEAGSVPPELVSDSHFIRAGSYLDDIDQFDAAFFGITPNEARYMDPQHRLFLEMCWEAIENAGIRLPLQQDRVGVFAGAGRNSYFRNVVSPTLRPQDQLEGGLFGLLSDIGNCPDYLATRVSFRLDLRGPSLNVQTACSTSLTAVHLACSSIHRGECELALAGGISIPIPQLNGYYFDEGSITSPDGSCRPFDLHANGTVFGSGGAVVLLKSLRRALEDSDPIVAVVRGSALNNDGARKQSFAAPSCGGQAEVIAAAMQAADVTATSIGYVEGHGTATLVGDANEIAALQTVFGAGCGGRTGNLALGSIKSNIGHVGTAAGAIGLIKAALATRHGKIPANAAFGQLHPSLQSQSGIFVPRATVEWPIEREVRRAGVNSFGIGGTNVHVVVEESPAINSVLHRKPDDAELFVVSGRSSRVVDTQIENLNAIQKVIADPVSRAEASYTLMTGRQQFEKRAFGISTQGRTTWHRLRGAGEEGPTSRVVLLFPGQGSQRAGVGSQLYRRFRSFAHIFDRVAAPVSKLVSCDMRELLFSESSHEQLKRTEWTQPALYVVELTLAKWLLELGLEPAALLGHSIGQYAAAVIAGVLEEAAAAELVLHRARAMANARPGSMLAVHASLDQLVPHLGSLSIAAVNGPRQVVVSGESHLVAALTRELSTSGIRATSLLTSHAFHSSMMSEARAKFLEHAAKYSFSSPRIPIISDIAACTLTDADATNPVYWADQICSTVRFHDALLCAHGGEKTIFVETGPGLVLSNLVTGSRNVLHDAVALPCSTTLDQEVGDALKALGTLWMNGRSFNWTRLWEGERPRKMSLPTYPFERQRFWLDPPSGKVWRQVDSTQSRLSTRLSASLEQCARVGSWSPKPTGKKCRARRTLVLTRDATSARAIGKSLSDPSLYCFAILGPRVPAPADSSGAAFDFAFRTSDQSVRQYLQALCAARSGFERVIYALSFNPDERIPREGAFKASSRFVSDDYLELLEVARAVLAFAPDASEQIFLTSNCFGAFGSSAPWKSLLRGLALTLPKEYPSVMTRFIDVSSPAESSDACEILAAELESEMATGDDLVWLRDGRRCVRVFDDRFDGGFVPDVRPNGKYLVIGGTGEIGSVFVEEMIRKAGSNSITVVVAARNRGAADSPGILSAAGSNSKIIHVGLDITSAERVAMLWEEWQGFDGIVHAAGIAGGQMLETHSAQHAEEVIGPKIAAAGIVELAAQRTDCWVILCSSIVSVAGSIGQSDYSAANCLLDTLASNAEGTPAKISTLNWDVWGGGGLAVKGAIALALRGARARPVVDDALFSTILELANGGIAGKVELFSRRHWMVADHVWNGIPTLSGTGFISLIHGLLRSARGATKVQLRNVAFNNMVVDGKDARSSLYLFCGPGRSSFHVRLSVFLSDDLTWQDCMEATVQLDENLEARGVPALHEIGKRFETALDGGPISTAALSTSALTFGPNWGRVTSFKKLRNEWLISCEGNARVDQQAHAGMLDLLLGSFLFDPQSKSNLFVPLSYDSVTLFAPIPARATAYARERLDAPSATRKCDVIIYDETGGVCAEVKGYTVLAVAEPVARETDGRAMPTHTGQAPRPGTRLHAISRSAGRELVRSVLARTWPQLVISAEIDRAITQGRISRSAEILVTGDGTAGGPATDLAGGELEVEIIRTLLNVLGIEDQEQVAAKSFIEIGGDSVSAARVVMKISEIVGKRVPVTRLLSSSTLHEFCLAVIEEPRGVDPDAEDEVSAEIMISGKV